MPEPFRRYSILDQIVFSTDEEEVMGIRKEVQLVKPPDGPIELRVCYYTRRRNPDGTEWWGLSPRPLTFSPHEAGIVSEAINHLSEKYYLLRTAIKLEDGE